MKVKKAPAAFTETEVLRLQLAYDKALLQIEKAVLSRSPDGGWGEAITDQNGRYEIGGLRSGVFNILLLDGAKKPLTAPAHEDVSVKSGEISKADFSLQTGRRLAGRVLDEITDEPVAKCVVGYYGPARPRSGGAILTVKTNERGEFEFFVPPGESHVYIADVRPNTPDSQGDVDVPADRDPEPIILKAGPKTEGGLKIFVGPPLERKVSVKLNREPLQSALEQICNAAAVKVNLDGDSLKTVGYTKNMAVTADLQNVPLGDALKHILKPFEHLDFIVEKDVVFVSTRKQTESRKKAGATAAPRSVKGVVKSESGQPIPGAHIALSRIGLIGGRHVTTDLATGQADDQGRYSVELTDEIRQAWTPTMKIAVWAIGKGVSAGIVRWVEDNPQVPPSERDQDFPLPPERALTVEIADEKEQPLKGHVLTFDLDGLRLPPQILKQMIRNPFEGTLTIHQMPSGFHEGSPALRTLRIQTASHGTLEFTWRVDQPGRGNIAHDDGLPVKLVAQPVTHLTGRLVAANGTLPAQVIRNVELSLETFHGDNSLKTPWVRGIAKVRTDAEGRFDIPTLACGKLTQVRTVLAADARWRPLLNNAERIALNPNATTNVDIPLTPTRTVRGQVRRPTGEGMPGVSFNISHGATVTQKLSEDRTSTTAAFFETVLTDLDGQFAVDLIPGDISFTMQFSSDTNIGTSELWPATKKGSTETQSGRFSQLPAGSEPLSLPTIYVSAYQGTLRDEAGKPVEAILVARGKTNSAAIGLTQTKKDGTFEIDVIGKADIWSAARRNEQGDFGLPGKDAPDVVVVSELPLVLQLKAGEESIPSAKAAAPAIDGLKPKEPSSPELEVENNDTIVDIQVEGNVSIADSSILPLVKTRKGRPASSKAVREDVMALFNTRWFTGVKPVYRNTSEGAVLIFRVTETNPSEPAASPAAVTRPGTPAQTTATVKLHPFETSTDNPAFDISLMKAISIAYRADHESMLHFDRISRDFAYGDFIWSADTKQLVGLRGATFVELKENLEEAAKIPLADLRRRLTGSLAQVAAKITDNQTGCMLVGSHEGHVLLLKTIKVQPRVLTVSLQRLTSDNEGRTEVPAVGIEQAVWGPVTDGLQAGIAYRDPDASRPASQYHLGELVRVKLFVRNTGQEPKSYSWRRWNINAENPVRIPLVDVWHPTILDAGGHQAITGRSKIHDSGERRTATLQPGETVFVGAASMALWPGINVGFGVFPNRQISVEVAPGRYQLSTELPTDLFGSTPIRTGSLQLDVVEPDKSQLNLIQQLDAIGHAVEPPEEDTSIGWRDATTGSPILAAFPRGPAEYQTIRCRAFDIETNQAVAGAVAKVAFMSFGDRMSDNLCEYDVLTGADGTFDMRIPRPLLSGFQRDWKPDYRVNITHPRYSETFDSQNLKDLQELGLVSNDGTIRNPAPAPELGTTRDPSKFASFQTVALKPARALSGRLLGADNKPLPNIHIYGSNSQGWPATPGLPRTDSEGRFQFNVPAKMTMKLEFRAAGFGRTFVTATPDQTNLGEIRPATGVRVGGLVLDAEGKPIPHIKVTTPSWPDQSSQPNFIYYADKDGRFQSDLLAAGEYQLEIGEISPPSERNKATISGPAPDLYVPVRFTVLADGKVPDFTIRPARATLIRSTLITTVPKPVKDEVARAIDPLYWRATVEKAQRERAKLKPSTPIKKTQTGQPVRFEVDDATGELAVKGDYEKQQDFAFNWVQAFFRIPNLLIRGKIGEQSWTRTPNFLELGSDTEPPAFTVKAPYDLTDVTFEPNDYVQHVQLDAGPKLFGKRFHVNQLGADIFDIKIYRYQPTTLKVTFVDAGGKRIVLPENELPSGFAVEARYAREAEVRKAGGRFDKSEGLMNPAILDDTVLRFVIPGEVIELSVTANGKEPIVRQITLEDGETRTITIQTEVQQTWNEHSAPTIQPATLKETKTP
jgi:protocatechuate 3,4-dioxygenase beta subunit